MTSLKDSCKICTEKIAVMYMLKKHNEFYCGVCGFRSKDDVKEMVDRVGGAEEKPEKKLEKKSERKPDQTETRKEKPHKK